MNLEKRSRCILFLWCLSVVVVIILSVLPRAEIGNHFWNADKVIHFFAYLWLAVLPMLGFVIRRLAVTAALSMIGLGILLEFVQYFIPSRSCSILDIAANIIGVILGILLGIYLRKRVI